MKKNRKLTNEQAKFVKESLTKNGRGEIKILARKFNLCRSSISNIDNGSTYREILPFTPRQIEISQMRINLTTADEFDYIIAKS